MKYKSRLGAKVAEQRAFETEQKQLRRKYKVEADGIIKIEKKPVMEVVIEYGSYVIKAVIIITLFVLIAIGILSLSYMHIAPEIPLRDILQELVSQFKGAG